MNGTIFIRKNVLTDQSATFDVEIPTEDADDSGIVRLYAMDEVRARKLADDIAKSIEENTTMGRPFITDVGFDYA